MANSGDINVGTVIRFNGELCRIEEYMHRTPGNLRAFYQARMRNLKNGKIVENRFRAGEAVEVVRVEYKQMQFIYPEGDFIVLMDNETFEQIALQENLVDAPQFLKEGQEVGVLINTETDLPMSVELPDKIVVLVTYSEPGMKGDTATRTLKPATVETGATVMVPLFVNEGELIRVNTKTGDYVERVKE